MPRNSLPKVRLILRITNARQSAPDVWHDATKYETFDLPCPASLYAKFSGMIPAIVVGAEIVEEAADDTPE